MVRNFPKAPTDNMSDEAQEFAHQIQTPQILPHSGQTEVASIDLKRVHR
jgi:hypothetical protein